MNINLTDEQVFVLTESLYFAVTKCITENLHNPPAFYSKKKATDEYLTGYSENTDLGQELYYTIEDVITEELQIDK